MKELRLTDVSSAKIPSPPDLNHITNITTGILVRDTSTATSEVVNSDSMAQGSFGSHGVITHALSAGILFRVQGSVDGNGTNRKRGVNRGNNLTKGEHATTGKRLHLQQQCNFLPPVEASGTIALLFPFNHWHQHSLAIMLIKIPHQDLKIYCRYQNSLLFLFKMMLL